jgi:hypothetical protein
MVVANALQLDGAVEGGDKQTLKQLQNKFAPKGVHRYAIAVFPDFTDIRFIKKGTREQILKIHYGHSEVPTFLHDLKFYAAMMKDGANRPLVRVLHDDEEEAA